jgi:tripartite-type tricarboxylate transporter receptor subunit TctC
MAGIEMVHVPNKGMNPAVVDLLAGEVQVLFASIPALQAEHADRVRVIAVAESRRSALMPALPTIAESGIPGFAVDNWAGLLGPAAMDAQIVATLHDAVVSILDSAEMQARIKTLGYDLIASPPREFAAQLASDIARWSDVVKRAKIPLN